MSKKRNEILKIRYHFLREQGYSSKDANRLKQRAMVDYKGLELGINKYGKTYVKKNKRYREQDLDFYIEKSRELENNTVYTNWGNLTHSKKLREETLKRARYIAKRDNKGLDYGYYYLYYMFQNDKTNEEMLQISSVDKSFEQYVKKFNNSGYTPKKKQNKRVKNSLSKVRKGDSIVQDRVYNFILFDYESGKNISVMGFKLTSNQNKIIIDGKEYDKGNYKYNGMKEVEI